MIGYKNKLNGWLIKSMGEYFKLKKTCGKQSTQDLGKHTPTQLKVQKPSMNSSPYIWSKTTLMTLSLGSKT